MPTKPLAPLSGLPLALATIFLSFASFMNILDITIANVSVPTIAGYYGVSYTQGTWIITSYAVAEAIMLPLTGWFATRFGEVRVFLTSCSLFVAASVLCVIAPDFWMLVLARVLQGVVGAAMIPLSQSILMAINPPKNRGTALGVWSMATVLAPICGPMLGGWLTESYSWHWVFLINLPVGVIVIFTCYLILRGFESEKKQLPIDIIGLLLLVIGVGSLQIMLDKGAELAWFESKTIISLAVVAFIGMIFFVVWELTEEHPMVNLRLFGKRNFLISSLCLFFGMMSYFGIVVIHPLWLQTSMGYTPFWAGKVVAFGGVLSLIIGPIIGRNMHRLDPRMVATAGFMIMAGGTFLLSGFNTQVDFWTMALSRLVLGAGVAAFFLPIITINYSGLASDEIAAASGLGNFMRNLGSSIGTAALISHWDHLTISHHAVLAQHVYPTGIQTDQIMLRLSEQSIPVQMQYQFFDSMIFQQAVMLATNDMMLICASLFVMLAIFVWFSRPPFTSSGGGVH